MSTKMNAADKTINQLIIKTYEFCEKENKFWHNSSLSVYEHYFPILKENYKKKYPHSEEIDFLKSEYVYFLLEEIHGLNTTHNTIAIDDKLKLVDYVSRLDITNREFFNITKQRKLDFVASEIQKAGYIIEVSRKNKVKVLKASELQFADVEDTELTIANLPSFNLEQRYEILRQMGMDKILVSLDTSKKNKNMLLALIMGASVDNAKKLLDGTYKKTSDEQKNKSRNAEITGEIMDFFERNKIKIKE